MPLGLSQHPVQLIAEEGILLFELYQAPPPGFQPGTLALEGRCSMH
jgi:hypothetical protein